MRDEFPEWVKRVLSGRVGGLCSKPGCHIFTSGPHSDNEEALSLGTAAHITAADENGPRYDRSLTREQRKAPSNGIWMCRNHGVEIDNDWERYTVEMLHDWKQTAEALADKRLGRTSVDPIAEARLRDDRMRVVGPILASISSQIALVRGWGTHYRGQSARTVAMAPYRKTLLDPELAEATREAKQVHPAAHRDLRLALERMERFEAMVLETASYESKRPFILDQPREAGDIPGLPEILDEAEASLISAEDQLIKYAELGSNA